MVVLGESGVGKTCLIRRIISDSYSPTDVATIGVDHNIFYSTISDEKMSIDLWDTSGQERYRNFGKIHYRDANCIILMYDIMNKDSVAPLEKYWLHGTLPTTQKSTSTST